MNNAEKMLAKIKKRHVVPTPKWVFLLKNIGFWVLFLISIKFGSLAFAIILFAIENTEFDLLAHITHSKLEFFLGLLPLFWLVFQVVFVFGAFELFRHTKIGYRYSPVRVGGGSFILSIIIGSVLFISGGSEKLEQKFAEKVPMYESLEEKRIKMWAMPQEGFLSGKIITTGLKKIIIQDFNEKEWQIEIGEASIRPRVNLIVGEKIKIIGKIISKNFFKAEEIKPWSGKGLGQKRNNSKK